MLVTKQTRNASKSLQTLGFLFDTAHCVLEWFGFDSEISISFNQHSWTNRTNLHLGDHGAVLVCFHLKF
jgi:hypothetical protein